MDITFSKVGELWEAEFEATADFAIHLEREKGGVFRIYQRTAGSQYALVDEVDKVYTQYKDTVDYDCSSLIFPKFIKVVSGTEPTYASIVSSGEITEIKSQAKSIEITSNDTISVEPDAGFSYLSKVDVKVDVPMSGGGSAPSSEEWIYWDVSNVSVDDNYNFRWLAHLINAAEVGIRAGGDIESRSTTKWATNLNCLHSDKSVSNSPILMKEYMTMTPMGDGKTVKVLLEEMGFFEITEEEFYTL